MRYVIRTGNRSYTLKIPITCNRECFVYVIVRSLEVPGAILIRRVEKYLQGDTTPMYLKMPLTGETIVVEIFDNLADVEPTLGSITVGTLKLMGLETKMSVVYDKDLFIDEWILFRGQFAFNASWLALSEEDQAYKSAFGRYRIRYVDAIMTENGHEDVTPMQINKYTKIISVSRRKLIEADLTVPAIVGLLDHEYSHVYRNEVKADEEESDLNGITITLGTGYPRYDVIEGYYSIIENVDSEENFNRLLALDDFAGKFYELAA